MHFHFIRHGKRDRKIGDPSLTLKGREETELLARRLASGNPLRGFASGENVT